MSCFFAIKGQYWGGEKRRQEAESQDLDEKMKRFTFG
jgi:hypothetical protein